MQNKKTGLPRSGFLKGANPELKAAMERGGVIGMPDLKILSKV